MAEQNIVKDVDTVYVDPAGGENVEDPNKNVDETVDDQDGAGGADEGTNDGIGAGPHKPEELVDTSKPVAPSAKKPEVSGDKNKVGDDGLHDVEDETPRERALRAKLAISEKRNRGDQAKDLGLGNTPAAQQASAPAPKNSARLQELAQKFTPQAIENLREVLPVLADEMGYVKAGDLSQQSYAQQSQAVLDEFLESHPEYSSENDDGGVLWDAFKNEYQIYNKPANPKDFAKIFNRIHTTIFGIKPSGDNGAINAQREKINVASHAGASGPGRNNAPAPKNSKATSGLRLDMLKGFDDDDIEDIQSRAST